MEGVNQRQISGNISFGNMSIYTAVIGKNGGARLRKWIGNVNHYKTGFHCVDSRDGEETRFDTKKELFAYFENKYADEIEYFKYRE